MGKWLTSKGGFVQSNYNNRVITNTNQLFEDNGTIYLIPRNTVTDNYTIPFGINKSKYDVRPSHLHDIGCYYHQVIIVNLPLEVVRKEYLYLDKDNRTRCKDIPIEYLEVKDIGFNECNNLLYKGMDGLKTIPKGIDLLYRIGVEFNLGWLLTGIDKINLSNIYIDKLYTFNNTIV